MIKTTLFTLSLLLPTLAFSQSPVQQTEIENNFMQSFATQKNQVTQSIDSFKEANDHYWAAYALYHSSIFSLKMGNKELGKTSIQEAIQLLESIEDKNSETHALIGYCLGFSITYDQSSAARISAKASAQYKKALKLNENNTRAYLGMGESDYYKPKAYGGGRKVEEYLLKAISLPAQTKEDGPSWGKNNAYHTLVQFYLREGQIDQAKMYCMQGLNQYPNDYQLNAAKQSF